MLVFRVCFRARWVAGAEPTSISAPDGEGKTGITIPLRKPPVLVGVHVCPT